MMPLPTSVPSAHLHFPTLDLWFSWRLMRRVWETSRAEFCLEVDKSECVLGISTGAAGSLLQLWKCNVPHAHWTYHWRSYAASDSTGWTPLTPSLPQPVKFRAEWCANNIFSSSVTLIFNSMRFEGDPFTCPCEKRRQEDLRVSDFTRLWVDFKWNHGSEGVKLEPDLACSVCLLGSPLCVGFAPPIIHKTIDQRSPAKLSSLECHQILTGH